MFRLTSARLCLLVFATMFLNAAGALAAPHEVRIPLKDGKLHVADLTAAVGRELPTPCIALGSGDLDVSQLQGAMLLRAMNASMGEAGQITTLKNVLVLRVDADKLPRDRKTVNGSIRRFVAEKAPQATVKQAAHWGLFLPPHIDANRPLVILIHGLDSDRGMLQPLGDLLEKSGWQVGYFCYPDDQPIDDSAKLFGGCLSAVHEFYPAMRVDIIGHSMGGLVARDYIENNQYAGGVGHLLLVGTPNGGSNWSAYRFALEVQQQYTNWRSDPDYNCSWMITDGLGEAGDDLKPKSEFLKRLNALPRREGVKYTIIAGSRHPASRIGAACAARVAGWMPPRASNWWGFRQCKNGLERYSDHLRNSTGDSDGPVKLKNAKLSGVDDFVVLTADHCSLFYPEDGHPPAAWDTIRDRLQK